MIQSGVRCGVIWVVICSVRCAFSGECCQAHGVRCVVSGTWFWFALSGKRCQLRGVRHTVSSARHQARRVRRALSGVQCQACGVRRTVSGMQSPARSVRYGFRREVSGMVSGARCQTRCGCQVCVVSGTLSGVVSGYKW